MIKAMKQALEKAYLAGFNAGGEGYNAEYPFSDRGEPPNENRGWVKDRDEYISQAIAEAEKERCTGCEACIDSACGRDECPKGWAKAEKQEPEKYALDIECERCGAKQSGVLTVHTHPQPKREWVGLTDDEIEDCYKQGGIGRAIQMLKEKNT